MSTVPVHIKTASGTKYTVQLDLAGTVGDLRKAVEEASQVPADQQRLIFKGKVLRDTMGLNDIGKGLNTNAMVWDAHPPPPYLANRTPAEADY